MYMLNTDDRVGIKNVAQKQQDYDNKTMWKSGIHAFKNNTTAPSVSKLLFSVGVRLKKFNLYPSKRILIG